MQKVRFVLDQKIGIFRLFDLKFKALSY